MQACRWVTFHWLRFGHIETPDTLDLSQRPRGAAGWKIGPDGEAADDGSRKPSDVWCAVGLYPERDDAEQAFAAPAEFLPFLGSTLEDWHALLQPIAHRGACNHLDREVPGPLLEAHPDDPGGPLVVMTTAGFDLGPHFDMARVVDFRRNVDRIRLVAKASDGNLAQQVFAPHVRGDDGVTMTVWRDDAAMTAFAYRPGRHRDEVGRYKRDKTADRTSFTRLRPLKTSGSWHGTCPVGLAPKNSP